MIRSSRTSRRRKARASQVATAAHRPRGPIPKTPGEIDAMAEHGLRFVAPPGWLCTDNAAMIGWAGAERFAAGLTDPLDTAARARWPLDPDAEKVRGAGVKA